MKEYNFTEATHLITFLKVNHDKIVGKCLKNLYIDYWFDSYCSSFTCEDIIIELGACFISINYRFKSNLTITVGTKEEMLQNRFFASIINMKYETEDYYNIKLDSGIRSAEIEGRMVNRISVEQFSEAFECNPVTGEIRPEGGDYFSTIRLCLDGGRTLCFCGANSMANGYTCVWCE